MTSFVKVAHLGARFRAAIGLIAAYAIALQTLFAALAPLPANAQAADLAGLHVLCFGSGIAAASDNADPDAPPPASGKFHCVLCGLATAAAAVLPGADFDLAASHAISIVLFAPAPALAPARQAVRAGAARAPPLTV